MANSAQRIADGLGAKRFGNSWRCPCPVCGEKNESKFKIAEGDKGPLVYCFAGCEFRDIVRELRAHGLWEDDKPATPMEARYMARESEIRKAKRDLADFDKVYANPSTVVLDSDWRKRDRAKAILAMHGVIDNVSAPS